MSGVFRPAARLAAAALLATPLLAAPFGAARADTPLLVLNDSVPSGLDSDGPSANHAASEVGMYALGEPLVQYARGPAQPDGTQALDFTRFEPALAESWSYDDPSHTWTFKLRHNVKSCAGNTFTADDVLYTFARAKSLSGQAPVGYFLASLASVAAFTPDLFAKTPEAMAKRELGDEVKKVDDYTIQIKQSQANPLLLPVLTIFGLLTYDQKEMKAHATAEDPWSHQYLNNVNLPSFGPYCLSSWRKSQDFTVTANPGYYDKKPYFDRVVYREIPQSSNRVAIIRSGQAQLVEGLNPKELDSLHSAKGIKVVGTYLNATMVMLLNYKTKPFDNLKLRQAIAYAVPYEDIVRTAYFGQARQYQGLIPSAYPGYHKPEHGYSYDPAKAKQLLADAGYPDGKGLEAFPGAFSLSYASERESIVGPAATLIQTRFKQLGIPVQLDPLPATQLSDRQLVKKDLPFSLYDQSKPIGVDTLYAMNLYFLTAPRGVNNMTNYSNPRVDELFTTARAETDAGKRSAMLAEAQNILMEQLPWVPLVENRLQFALQDNIKGVVINPAQFAMWRFLYR